MKRVVNPFSKFLRNILIGFILMLTCFSLVPIIKNLTKNEVVAEADEVVFYTYDANWNIKQGGEGSVSLGPSGNKWEILSNSNVVGVFSSNQFTPDSVISLDSQFPIGKGKVYCLLTPKNQTLKFKNDVNMGILLDHIFWTGSGFDGEVTNNSIVPGKAMSIGNIKKSYKDYNNEFEPVFVIEDNYGDYQEIKEYYNYNVWVGADKKAYFYNESANSVYNVGFSNGVIDAGVAWQFKKGCDADGEGLDYKDYTYGDKQQGKTITKKCLIFYADEEQKVLDFKNVLECSNLNEALKNNYVLIISGSEFGGMPLIGTKERPFQGIFICNSIINVYVNSWDQVYYNDFYTATSTDINCFGFFKYLSNAYIKYFNLELNVKDNRLDNVTLEGIHQFGLLACYMENTVVDNATIYLNLQDDFFITPIDSGLNGLDANKPFIFGLIAGAVNNSFVYDVKVTRDDDSKGHINVVADGAVGGSFGTVYNGSWLQNIEIFDLYFIVQSIRASIGEWCGQDFDSNMGLSKFIGVARGTTEGFYYADLVNTSQTNRVKIFNCKVNNVYFHFSAFESYYNTLNAPLQYNIGGLVGAADFTDFYHSALYGPVFDSCFSWESIVFGRDNEVCFGGLAGSFTNSNMTQCFINGETYSDDFEGKRIAFENRELINIGFRSDEAGGGSRYIGGLVGYSISSTIDHCAIEDIFIGAMNLDHVDLPALYRAGIFVGKSGNSSFPYLSTDVVFNNCYGYNVAIYNKTHVFHSEEYTTFKDSFLAYAYFSNEYTNVEQYKNFPQNNGDEYGHYYVFGENKNVKSDEWNAYKFNNFKNNSKEMKDLIINNQLGYRGDLFYCPFYENVDVKFLAAPFIPECPLNISCVQLSESSNKTYFKYNYTNYRIVAPIDSTLTISQDLVKSGNLFFNYKDTLDDKYVKVFYVTKINFESDPQTAYYLGDEFLDFDIEYYYDYYDYYYTNNLYNGAYLKNGEGYLEERYYWDTPTVTNNGSVNDEFSTAPNGSEKFSGFELTSCLEHIKDYEYHKDDKHEKTVYAIFNKQLIIYTTVSFDEVLQNNGSMGWTVFGDYQYKVAKISDIKKDKNNNIKEGSIYKFSYSIEMKMADKEKEFPKDAIISNAVIRKFFGEYSNGPKIDAKYVITTEPVDEFIDIDGDISNGIKQGFKDAKTIKRSDDSPDYEETTCYLTPYKNMYLYFGALKPDEDVGAYYDSPMISQELYLSFNDTKIEYDFSEVSTLRPLDYVDSTEWVDSGYKLDDVRIMDNITVDRKLYYTFINKIMCREEKPTGLISSGIIVTDETNIYVKGDAKLYIGYSKGPTIKIEYYTELSKLIYSQDFQFSLNPNTHEYVSLKIDALSYNEACEKANLPIKDYSFMGWKMYWGSLNLNVIVLPNTEFYIHARDENINATTENEQERYRNGEFILKAEDTYMMKNGATFKLYPVMVMKNDGKEYCDIVELPEYDLSSNTYYVKSAEDLIAISNLVNVQNIGNINIELKNNINMDGYKNFYPIGMVSRTSFMGNFNGNGYTISGLEINPINELCLSISGTAERETINYNKSVNASSIYYGLFGIISNIRDMNGFTINEIKNVNIINSYIRLSNITQYAGILAGACYAKAISNVLVQGGFKGLGADDGKYAGLAGEIGKTLKTTKEDIYTTTHINECIVSVEIGNLSSSLSRNIKLWDFTTTKGASNSILKITNSFVHKLGYDVTGLTDNQINLLKGKNGNSLNYFTSLGYTRLDGVYAFTGADTVFHYIDQDGEEVTTDMFLQVNGEWGTNSGLINGFIKNSEVWATSAGVNVRSEVCDYPTPYLKNTGIIKAKFDLNACDSSGNGGYVLTFHDKNNIYNLLVNGTIDNVTKEDNKYTFNKDFFLLDKYSFSKNIYDYSTENAGLVIKGSRIFNQLEGYEFVSLKRLSDNKTIDNNTSSSDKSSIFTNNGETYELQFKPKKMSIVYGYRNETGNFIPFEKATNIDYGTHYTINYNITTKSITGHDYLIGKEVDYFTAYYIKNIGTVPNTYYLDNTYGANSINSITKFYNGDQFLIDDITDISEHIFNEQALIYVEMNLKDIVYVLDYYSDNAQSEHLGVFKGAYGAGPIWYPPLETKRGYDFAGWAYFTSVNKVNYFGINGNLPNYNYMPDILREANIRNCFTLETLLSKKDVEGNYHLDLLPVYIPKVLKITYIDVETGSVLATQNNVEFDSLVSLYNHKQLSKYGYVLNNMEIRDENTEDNYVNNYDDAEVYIVNANEHLNNKGALSNAEYLDAYGYKNDSLNISIHYTYDGNITIYCYFTRANIEFSVIDNDDVLSHVKYVVLDEKGNEVILNTTTEIENDYKQIDPLKGDKLQRNNAIEEKEITNGEVVSKKFSCVVKYGYSVKIYVVIKTGARITNFAGINNLYKNIGMIANYNEYIVSDISASKEIKIYGDKLIFTEYLDEDGDGKVYIDIYNASDLYSYFTFAQYEGEGIPTYYGQLKNNINITGYNFDFTQHNGELEGNNFTINGFTSWSIETNSIINYNKGTIKNVNFDNIYISNEYFEEYNYGFININDGTLSNVNLLYGFINLTVNDYYLNITKDKVEQGYIGVITGKNKGIIEGVTSSIQATIKTNEEYKTPIIYSVGVFAAINEGGKINKAINEGITDISSMKPVIYKGITYNHSAGSIGLIDKAESIVTNIINKANFKGVKTDAFFGEVNEEYSYNNVKYLVNFNSDVTVKNNHAKIDNKTIKNLREKTYNELVDELTKDLTGSSFIVAFNYNNGNAVSIATFVIKGLNVQIFNVSSRLINTNSSGITSKINYGGNNTNNSFNIYRELKNRCGYNSEEYENSSTSRFNLTVYLNGQPVTEYFNISVNENNILTSNKPEIKEVNFVYEAKILKDFEYKINFTEESNFTSEEINKILTTSSFKIKANEEYKTFTFEKDEDNDLIYFVTNAEIRFNDDIVLGINLPNFARLSINKGFSINESSEEESLGKSNYSFEKTMDTSDFEKIKLNAEIEKSIFKLKIYLNDKDLKESEDNNIFYNETRIDEINASDPGGDIIAVINEEDDSILTYSVKGVKKDGEYVYYSPDLNNIIAYEYNGNRYKLIGLYLYDEDKNKITDLMYYNEKLQREINFIEGDITLYAEWEAVEYTIIIDNLTSSVAFTKLSIKDINYNLTSDYKCEAKIKFGEEIYYPISYKVNYTASYVFNGYYFNETRVSDYGDEINNANSYQPIEGYKTLNAFFTDNDSDGDKKLTITPNFIEVTYNIKFNSNDNYRYYTTLKYVESDSENIDVITKAFNITDLKNLAVGDIPYAEKIYHNFAYYKAVINEEERIINYNASKITSAENKFVDLYINKGYEVFISNLNGFSRNENITINRENNTAVYNDTPEFLAYYEIDLLNITINVYDNYQGETLEFNKGSTSLQNFLNVLRNMTDNEEAELDFTEDNKIKFTIPFNTTGVSLPILELLNNEYKHTEYFVWDSSNTNGGIWDTSKFKKYNTNYVFRENIELTLICKYKITFNTKGGEVETDYTNKLDSFSANTFFMSGDETLILPTAPEVIREGFTLSGYKVNGISLDAEPSGKFSFTCYSPSTIEFMYVGNVYTITLNSSGATLPEDYVRDYSVIETYNKIDDNTATIEVVYATNIKDILLNLPELNLLGFTLDSFTIVCGLINDEVKIGEINTYSKTISANNGTITANFIENVYNIDVVDNSNNNVYNFIVNKKINEEITEVFTPIVHEGLTYIGLSLTKEAYSSFNLPENMPDLTEAYPNGNIEVNHNITKLTLYAYYVSEINVTISAKVNSLLIQKDFENNIVTNFVGLDNLVGGDSYNSSLNFIIKADAILEYQTNSNAIKLPVPTVKEDLLYATFKGYKNGDVLVTDNNGYLSDTFVLTTNVYLTQEFEYNNYDFNIYANYSSVSNLEEFVETDFGFNNKISFNSEIGNLPIVTLNNHSFVGYYISNNTDNIVDDLYDVKISDENGVLLENYKKLNSIYFNDGVYTSIKNYIVAKYNYETITIDIVSNNTILGTIKEVKYADSDLPLQIDAITNGYRITAVKNNRIQISVETGFNRAEFINFTASSDAVITNIIPGICNVSNLKESCVITANFEPKTFSITYIINGEEVTNFIKDGLKEGEVIELLPNSYNTLEEVILPNFEKYGYNFIGWYEEESFINKRTNIDLNSYNDKVFYGKVEEKLITINVFNNLDNYNNFISYNAKFDKLFDCFNNLSEQDYDFVGYFTLKDKQGIKLNNSSLCVFGENFINVYAYFEPSNNTSLSGEGTKENPYEINNFIDYKKFASMINAGVYNNSNIYYKLTNNINLESEIIIENFKANLNADGYVIYADNILKGYNILTEEGKVIRNVSLVLNNEGIIENLIFVNKISELNNLICEYESDENKVISLNEINITNIAVNNSGKINNVINYYNISVITNTTCNFNTISVINEGEISGCYSYNSKFIINSEENIVNESGDYLHNYNLNRFDALTISEDGKFAYINNERQFAYLINNGNIYENYEIVLTNNLNMKGKIFNALNNNLKINGNGHIISNLTVLNETNLFNNVSLKEIGFENLAIINLFEDCVVINNATEINKVYITSYTSNFNCFINLNNKIENAYVLTQQNINFVNENLGNIKNIYITKGNIVNTENGTTTNAVVFNLTLDDLQTQVNEFLNNINDKTIWFKDETNVMNSIVLPQLVGVGNYVIKFNYDNSKVIIDINPLQFTNIYETNTIISKAIILKDVIDIKFSYSFVGENSEHYVFNKILLNNNEIALFAEFNNLILSASNIKEKVNNLDLIIKLRDYQIELDIEDENKNKLGGLIELNGEQNTYFNVLKEACSTITIKAIANEGYKFVGWSDGNNNAEREITVLENINLTAKFEKLVKYVLNLDEQTTINIENTDWFASGEDRQYVIYLEINKNVEDYLPVLVKPDYILVSYNKLIKNKISNYEYNVTPNFTGDYKQVNFVYDNKTVSYTLNSVLEYSVSGLEIVKVSGDLISVLNGYEIKVVLIPDGYYLTDLRANNARLFNEEFYANLKATNSTEPIEFIYLINNDTEFVITMNIINILTNFEYDSDLVNITLLNDAYFNGDGYVNLKKASKLQFKLNINETKQLSKMEVYNKEGILVEDVVIEYNDITQVYSYTVLQDATIKIIIEERIFNVNIFANIGGEIIFEENITSTDIENDEYFIAKNINVKYDNNILLYINSLDNYILDSIIKIENNKETKLTNTSRLEIKNIKNDITLIINFVQQDTWLDTDNNGNIKYFIYKTFQGNGTINSPYILKDMHDFLTLAYNVNFLKESYNGKYFITRTTDIELSFSGHYFMPIGTEETSFAGIILGNNLTLTNIKILGNKNVGLFKTLTDTATIKAINVYGEIEGCYNVGSIAGTNNGNIINCNNFAKISTNNYIDSEENIVGGIVAVNNGTVTRSYNAGIISSLAKHSAGICVINNGTIENIYNTAQITSNNSYLTAQTLAGIVANNNGIVKFGYNNSRLFKTSSVTDITISGTTIDSAGTSSDIYYNTNNLTAEIGEGKTEAELIDQTNEIYNTWNFENVWYFDNSVTSLTKYPQLKIAYEYNGSITFNVSFDEKLSDQEKILLIELTNGNNLNYGVALTNESLSQTIEKLAEDNYVINVYALLGGKISFDAEELNITLNESVGDNITINFVITKTEVNGYYGKVVIK